MPLDETVESLEGVDERYHGLYEQGEDGKFSLTDVSSLKSALQQERKIRKQLEKKSKADLDNIPDVAEMTVKLEEAQKTIKDMKVGSYMKDAALAAGVHPEYVDDVINLTKGSFGLSDDGKVVHLDADGEPSGLDAEKFFNSKFKQTKPIYYVNSGRKGTGAHQTFDGQPSAQGRIQKAIEAKDTRAFINETMSKVKKI
jgi:hypothetical protein